MAFPGEFAMRRLLPSLLLLFAFVLPAAAAEPTSTRKEDVIYGRKFGVALTMDVFTPRQNANGAGLIFAVSGGWYSAKEAINVKFVEEFLQRGYTVFAVV